MNKFVKIITIILTIFLMSFNIVNATPTLYISDGKYSVTVQDGSSFDSNPLPGVVMFNNDLDLDKLHMYSPWFVNVTTGITKPVLGTRELPHLDLSSVNVSSKTFGSTSLTIMFSDVDFGPLSQPAFTADVGGTSNGSLSYSVYLDDSNTLFGKQLLLANLGPYTSGAFSGSVTSGSVSPGPSFSMTLAATITHGIGIKNSSFDLDVYATPEPGTLILLGSGLICAALYSRKRKCSKQF